MDFELLFRRTMIRSSVRIHMESSRDGEFDWRNRFAQMERERDFLVSIRLLLQYSKFGKMNSRVERLVMHQMGMFL